MIIKNYEINKINLINNKYFLLYGSNEGYKKEVIDSISKKTKIKEIIKFEENQIIENNELLTKEVLEKSLFNDEKIIIINRSSDKLYKIIEDILDRKQYTYIIINAGILEKKSKLRIVFEKKNNLICIPFYSDNLETLTKIATNYFKEKRISISQSNINLLVNRCNGDRGILKNELDKIDLFLKGKKKLNTENLSKLTNLIENHSISELIDNCLAKNTKKTLNILNDNLYTNEDSILILKTLLNKCKKILRLANEYKINKDINFTISSAKPPIFWKDKEITKQQLSQLSSESIKEIIYKLNEIELEIKSNFNNSVFLIRDYIINLSSKRSNN